MSICENEEEIVLFNPICLCPFCEYIRSNQEPTNREGRRRYEKEFRRIMKKCHFIQRESEDEE